MSDIPPTHLSCLNGACAVTSHLILAPSGDDPDFALDAALGLRNPSASTVASWTQMHEVPFEHAKSPDSIFSLRPSKCYDVYCPRSCGWVTRKALANRWYDVLRTFNEIQFVTLSVPPDLIPGASPQAILEHLYTSRAISLTFQSLKRDSMKPIPTAAKLHSTRWICAWHFSQSGVPHAHLVVDAAWVDPDQLTQIWHDIVCQNLDGAPPFYNLEPVTSRYPHHDISKAAWGIASYLAKGIARNLPSWAPAAFGSRLPYSTSPYPSVVFELAA